MRLFSGSLLWDVWESVKLLEAGVVANSKGCPLTLVVHTEYWSPPRWGTKATLPGLFYFKKFNCKLICLQNRWHKML